MRGSSPLPNRVGWVHSPSFPKNFSQLPIAGPALCQRYASGRMDGRKRPGGAEKARLKKRKALEEDAAKLPSSPIYFQEDNHMWQLVKKDIGLMISNVTIRLTL